MKKLIVLSLAIALILITGNAFAWQYVDGGAGQQADLNMTWTSTWTGTEWVNIGTPDYQSGYGNNGYVAGVESSEGTYSVNGPDFVNGGVEVYGEITGDITFFGHNEISGYVDGGNDAYAWGDGQTVITNVNGTGTVMLRLNLTGDTRGYSAGVAEWNYNAGNTEGGGFGESIGSVNRTFDGTHSVSASASNFSTAGAGTSTSP